MTGGANPELCVESDPDALARAAADAVEKAAEAAIAARGRFTLVLAGGSTPKRLYSLLAREPGRIDWERTEVFFGDERCVPPDHEGSNFATAEKTLLGKVPLRRGNLHRIRGELGPSAAASAYAGEIAAAFGVSEGGAPPRFDLVLLGLGENAHTASLFPGSPVLSEKRAWVAAAKGGPPVEERVTLTLPVLDAAREVIFLVSGERKAEALARVLSGARDSERLPAQAVRPEKGRLRWMVDAGAASRLQRSKEMRVLAGDIGGTKTALGVFRAAEGGLVSEREERFSSRDHDSLAAMIGEFFSEAQPDLAGACFGIAGPVAGGHVHTTNLPWEVDGEAIARALKTPRVELVNDLQAGAYGMLVLSPDQFAVLQEGHGPKTRASVAVVSPGTGLGEALLFWDGRRYHALASEAGHADFAPRNDLEMDLLRYLLEKFRGHVSYERVLSGDGLFHLYSFLKDSGRYEEASWVEEKLRSGDRNQTVSEIALSGRDDLCVAALRLFVSVLGAESANAALRGYALGGVFLGGGIPPAVLPALKEETFLEAFRTKGRFSDWVSQLFVRVSLEPRAPLLGAADHCLRMLTGETRS